MIEERDEVIERAVKSLSALPQVRELFTESAA